MIAMLLILAGAAPAASHGFTAPPPQAYLDPADREMARTHSRLPGRPGPCTHEEVQNGIKVIVGAPTERCYRTTAPRRWRGLWRDDFEGSQLCPAPATSCTYDSPGERIWLSLRPDRHATRKLYRVDFIGRKTLYRGAYGHMGASDQEIVVDRMISAREVPQ